MKRLGFLAAFAGLAAMGFAGGPYFIYTIGSAEGSMSLDSIYANGYIEGYDGMFDPAGSETPLDTIWRNNFMIHNVTDNATFWADGASVHMPKVPDGIISTTSSSLFNVGINYGSNLTGDLQVTLAQVVAGQSSRLNFQWNFTNAAATAKTIRLLWFMDGDFNFLDADYMHNMILRVNNTMAAGPALAMGVGTADANVFGTYGVLLEGSVPLFVYGTSGGIGEFSGVDYWANGGSYAGLGPAVSKDLDASLVNKIQRDENNNGAADLTGDTTAVLRAEITIPALSSQSVIFRATWGNNVTYAPSSRVADWGLY